MVIEELYEKLKDLGLSIIWDIDYKQAFVRPPNIANPIIVFDAYTEEYNGSVIVKSINTRLFTEHQIREALLLVDDFLHTPKEERNLPVRTEGMSI